jgi:hypothetical protein
MLRYMQVACLVWNLTRPTTQKNAQNALLFFRYISISEKFFVP